MRSSNPVFSSIERQESYVNVEAANYQGIIVKTALLFLIAVVSGFASIYLPASTHYTLLAMSGIVAFISVMIASFSVRLAPIF